MANWGEIAAMLQTLGQSAGQTQNTFNAQADRDSDRAMNYHNQDQASQRNMMDNLIGAGTQLSMPRMEKAADIWHRDKVTPGTDDSGALDASIIPDMGDDEDDLAFERYRRSIG